MISILLRRLWGRLLHSIGMELRLPFPKGCAVKSADWTLLDPVRKRGKIYRDAD